MDDAQNRITPAIARFLPLAKAHPENDLIVSGLARSLRKAGRQAEAKTRLEPLAAQPDVLSMVVYEMILLELELGNYREAKKWFDEASPTSLSDEDMLTAAAITLSMLGNTMACDTLITAMFDKKAAKSQVDDLRVHLTANPQDWAAAGQLQKAMQQVVARIRGREPLCRGTGQYGRGTET